MSLDCIVVRFVFAWLGVRIKYLIFCHRHRREIRPVRSDDDKLLNIYELVYRKCVGSCEYIPECVSVCEIWRHSSGLELYFHTHTARMSIECLYMAPRQSATSVCLYSIVKCSARTVLWYLKISTDAVHFTVYHAAECTNMFSTSSNFTHEAPREHIHMNMRLDRVSLIENTKNPKVFCSNKQVV